MDNARLKKLVLMLSSDQPGEASNAAAQITKALAADGKDWHWFADQVAGNVNLAALNRRVESLQRDRDYAYQAAANAQRQLAEITSAAQSKWAVALRELGACNNLRPNEHKFVQDLRNKFSFNPHFKPSEKQANWFASLHDTYVLAPRRAPAPIPGVCPVTGLPDIVSDADLTGAISLKVTGLQKIYGDEAVPMVVKLVEQFVTYPKRSTEMTQEQRRVFLSKLAAMK
jgi:hypothetical protein